IPLTALKARNWRPEMKLTNEEEIAQERLRATHGERLAKCLKEFDELAKAKQIGQLIISAQGPIDSDGYRGDTLFWTVCDVYHLMTTAIAAIEVVEVHDPQLKPIVKWLHEYVKQNLFEAPLEGELMQPNRGNVN